MNYYVIGIGGTGAKCIEALTHLVTAGMMPDGTLHTIFVDADTANGNVERTQIALKQYIACRQLEIGNTELFKTEITLSNPEIWSPVTANGGSARQSLNDIFSYNILRARQKENSCLADLFDVLFSPEEKSTLLEKGFRGHPSIGAAVMANAMQFDTVEPWKTIIEEIANDVGNGKNVKLFVFGSIFGGTGAAGFPTIARLIRDAISKQKKFPSELLNLGGALILPYFSFISKEDCQELRANSEDFLLNTQAALKYYHHQNYDQVYDSIYLLGDESMNPAKNFSIGARNQQNDPHFIEIYAALAAIDFFKNKKVPHYRMVARHEAEKIEWQDLPDGNSGNNIKNKLRQLTRFSVAFLEVYHPMLEDIRTQGKGHRAPWYVDFFERQQVVLSDNETQDSLRRIKEYCESYLDWLKMVHTFADSPAVQLVNWNVIAHKRGVNEFRSLILPTEGTDSSDLNIIWKIMCDRKSKESDPKASPFGKFIQALYSACA
jgi:hypothetical protein